MQWEEPTLICILFSYSVFAKDFRVLNFGDSCVNLVEQEFSLGSQQIGESKVNFVGYFVYKDVPLGEEVKIKYNCNKRQVFQSGYIFYEFENDDGTNKLYLDAFTLLKTYMVIRYKGY